MYEIYCLGFQLKLKSCRLFLQMGQIQARRASCAQVRLTKIHNNSD